MDYAINKVNQTMGIQVANYKYKAMVMPKNNGVIPWRGLGTQPGFYSWYNTFDFDISLYLHEFGHNFGFGHAMKNGDEYGDSSCVMGMGNNCFASPHRNYMMWDKPKMTLNWGWVVNETAISYWNATFELKKIGEYILLNDQLYIEATEYNIYAYMLHNNMSTSTECELSEGTPFCAMVKYNISMTLLRSNENTHVFDIQTGIASQNNSTMNIHKKKSSASNTVIYIYELLCLTFITYNILMFIIAIHL